MTLLTMSIVGGTFAKYISSDAGKDTARVAKWGVTVATTGNLFGTDYSASSNTADNTGNTIMASTSSSVSTAKGESRSNIVAPGTENQEGFKISISGTPEVAYDIKATDNDITASEIWLNKGTYGVMVEAKGLNAAAGEKNGTNTDQALDIQEYYTKNDNTGEYTPAEEWKENVKYYKLVDKVIVSDIYYPITWSIDAGGNATKITDASRLSDIASKMRSGIEKEAQSANSDLNASYTLTWKWNFDQSKDSADTILGDLQVKDNTVVKLQSNNTTYKAPTEAGNAETENASDYNLKNEFGMKVTVSQID